MFMALSMTAGEHELKLVYNTPGLEAGWMLWLIGCIGCICRMITEKLNT